jgi:ATP-binding cassette subfamily F protein uup
VSHDRDFLDRLVTAVIAMEGSGRTLEVAGGYSDYHRYRQSLAPGETRAKPAAKAAPTPAARAKRTAKLSYKDQRELDQLPARIDRLAVEAAAVEQQLADPALYKKDPAGFAKLTEALTGKRRELAAAEERWLELESEREALEKGHNGEFAS